MSDTELPIVSELKHCQSLEDFKNLALTRTRAFRLALTSVAEAEAEAEAAQVAAPALSSTATRFQEILKRSGGPQPTRVLVAEALRAILFELTGEDLDLLDLVKKPEKPKKELISWPIFTMVDSGAPGRPLLILTQATRTHREVVLTVTGDAMEISKVLQESLTQVASDEDIKAFFASDLHGRLILGKLIQYAS